MKQVIFDFKRLVDRDAFYHDFALQFQLDDKFGDNLDALWDVLMGGIALPVSIVFKHFPHHSRDFQPLVQLMQEAENELGKDVLSFHCEHTTK
ncbi:MULTISPECIES: barstar family protein [Enterobacterales]|uniref:barstar family protein n=1 Tax=Enterobacterales TaxID=91347 RepID=UPI0008482BC0|nr:MULTISPECIES: barstar family protein [Enterobacterales]WOO50346.1 barstar family protein [Hafnia alvei]MCK9782449.1 barstar family protein [Proteus columbae]MCT6517711.1 barstar family protein [Proteus vulgaris]ODQ06299.1 ribonuclease inhibitor [Shigella sp. FC130]OEI93811.1 ribonuclease inhibitor [Shigella sp. FC1655]